MKDAPSSNALAPVKGDAGSVPSGRIPSVKISAGAAPAASSLKAAPVVLGANPKDSTRNLVLGVTAVLLALPLGGLAFWVAQRESLVALFTAVLLGLLVFLAMQFRLMLQRNGVFLLMSAGLLLTLIVPLGVRMFSAGSEWAEAVAEVRRARQDASASQSRATPPAALAREATSPLNAPASGASSHGSAPSTQAASEQGTAAQTRGTPAAAAQSNSGQDPAPAQGAASVPATTPPGPAPVAALQTVGSVGAVPAASGVPSAASEPARTDEDPTQRASRLAKEEMIRRYPNLQDPVTPEYKMYLDAYNELARLRKFEFFEDPRWPLKIAEMVAKREGWKRADLAAPEAPAKPEKQLPGEELALDKPGAAPEGDSFLQEVNRSMIEARRRFPAIGREGSPENRAYLEAYQELDKLRPNFFVTPDWPVRLVELVAKQENWKRSDAAPSGAKVAGEEKDLALPR